MSRPSNNRDLELRSLSKTGQAYYDEKPRTSSVAALQFQRLKQIQQNEVAADKSRKTSRISKGLNPDVPKPRKINTGND